MGNYLAVDDIISDIGAANTIFSFQPASGVEVMITAIGGDGQTLSPDLTDAVLFSSMLASDATASITYVNMKMGLTNDNFLSIPALGATFSSSFMGIQIK